MNLKEKFNKFISEQTSDAFHDAILLKIILDFDDEKIIIEIEHWNDKNANIEKEGYYICDIIFYNINNLFLNKSINSFLNEDEIDGLTIDLVDNKYYFKFSGIQGWIFSFSSTDFKYTNKYKGLNV